MSGLTSGVSKVSVNTSHVCAVQNGAAKCWGAGQGGVLGDGDGSIHNRSTPVTPSGLGSGVTDVASGWRHTCAIQTGEIKCWGNNTNYQLGYTGPYNVDYPWVPRPLASPPPGTPVKITAGSETNCALMSSGAVYCWGSNDAGKLGAGSSAGESVTPLKVTGLSAVTDVHINAAHACALQGGAAFCWGDGQYGKLGQQPALAAGQRRLDTAGRCRAVRHHLHRHRQPQHVRDRGRAAVLLGQQRSRPARHRPGRGVLRRAGAGHRLDARAAAARPTTAPVVVKAPLPLFAKISTPARGTSKLSKARLATLATVACPAGAACRVSAPKTVKVKIRKRRFTLTVLGAGAIAPGRKATIRVRLTKAAAKRLRKKTVKVKLRLTTTVNGMAISRTVTVKVKGRG